MDNNGSTHFHFLIIAWDRRADNGDFLDSVQIDVIADDSETAMTKVKELVNNKKGYTLRSVVEHLQGACVIK